MLIKGPTIMRSKSLVAYLVTKRSYCAITKTVDSTLDLGSRPKTAATSSDLGPNVDSVIKIDSVQEILNIKAPTSLSTFDEVPGPVILRRIASIWNIIPIVGTQLTSAAVQYILGAGKVFSGWVNWGVNMWIIRYLLNKYGPLVRLRGPFGGDVVLVSRPEHISAIMEGEGTYPIRSCLDTISNYRLKYRGYRNMGPFLENGQEWEYLRTQIERPLKSSMEYQLEKIDKTCDAFLVRISDLRNRQDEIPNLLYDEILKWSAENIFFLVFNKQMGFLDSCGLSPTSDSGRFLKGLKDATRFIKWCETGFHIWRLFETPTYRLLVKNCDIVDSIINKYVQRTHDTITIRKREGRQIETENVSLLEHLLFKENIKPHDTITIIMDMFLIGVNTTAHSVAFLMYHLAKNPRAQKTLYQEIESKRDVPKSKNLLQDMPYLAACIKESMRLAPPMPIINRVLNNDVQVYNYRIPQGTHVIMATYLNNFKEEYFEDALKFKPERWMGQELTDDIYKTTVLPFGVGPRICVAKDFAELQMGLLICKVLDKFRIEYNYGDIRSTKQLLASSSQPFKLRFVDRV